jgi:predicted O-methyltransferase YrrM
MSGRIPVLAALAVTILGVQVAWSQRPAGGGRLEPGSGGAANPLIRVFDTNGDGTLSAEEIEGASARLKALDTSKDGSLSGEELRRASGPAGGGPGRVESGSPLDRPPQAKDEQEQRILSTLDAARRGNQRYANVSEADGRLLRQLTEAVGARRVVELGTSTGESGMWFSLALRKTGGHLYTHDIDAGRIAVARENFRKAGVENLITIVEGNAHETATRNTDPIDVLFIDAEKEGYDAYLRELLPLVRPGGLIIAHNMRYPTPNAGYIEAITTSPDLDTSFVLMEGAGVGITLKKR